MRIRQASSVLVIALFGVLAAAPQAYGQGLFDRLKKAASSTVSEATQAAKDAATEAGMEQAGFLMLAEGGFAGTAAPWIEAGEPVAFAEIPGNAYVSANRLALVLCQPGALDGIVFQGDFSAVGEGIEMTLADNAFSVFLVQDGRATPMRNNAGQLGSLTTGRLKAEPGEQGGVMGTVSLAIGEDAVGGPSFLADLFARSRVVEVNGNFRAQPVDSIEQVNCQAGSGTGG